MLWENPKDAIITLMILLMVIGCVNVFSASFVRAEAMTGNPYHFLVRYLGYAAAGGLVFCVTAFQVNYKRLMSSFAGGDTGNRNRGKRFPALDLYRRLFSAGIGTG